jgi:hypothetical protein
LGEQGDCCSERPGERIFMRAYVSVNESSAHGEFSGEGRGESGTGGDRGRRGGREDPDQYHGTRYEYDDENEYETDWYKKEWEDDVSEYRYD